MPTVDDLVTDIDRGSVLLEGKIDDVDGPVYSRAEPSGIG
jgi:hypothetical protein